VPTDGQTHTQTDTQTQTDFIICPMLYAIAMGQIIIIIIVPLIWLRHPLNVTSIWHKHTKHPIQETACHAGQQQQPGLAQRGRLPERETAPSLANNPIRPGLNVADTRQMAPQSTHLIIAASRSCFRHRQLRLR